MKLSDIIELAKSSSDTIVATIGNYEIEVDTDGDIVADGVPGDMLLSDQWRVEGSDGEGKKLLDWCAYVKETKESITIKRNNKAGELHLVYIPSIDNVRIDRLDANRTGNFSVYASMFKNANWLAI